MNRPILAVVDDLFFHSKIKTVLEPEGYPLEFVSDSAAALSRARSARPALVIIDLALQKGDPFDLIKTMKEELGLAVLAYTHHVDHQSRQKALEAGCDKVVAKSEFSNKMPILVGSLI